MWKQCPLPLYSSCCHSVISIIDYLIMIFKHCVRFHLSCSYFCAPRAHRAEPFTGTRFILATENISPSAQHLSCSHKKKWPNLQMNRKENEAVRRRRVREGTEESAKPLCLFCVRNQQLAQRARLCQTCCQMRRMFITSWIRSPLLSSFCEIRLVMSNPL